MVTVTSHDAAGPANAYVTRATPLRLGLDTAAFHHSPSYAYGEPSAAWTNADVRGALVEASDAMDRAARGMSARVRVERRVVMLWGRGASGRVGTRSSTPEEPRRVMMNTCVLFCVSHREKA